MEEPPARRSRIRVALIHDGREERLAHARPTTAAVSSALAAYGDVEQVEIFRQPPFVPRSTRALVARHARQWRIERRWARHLGVGGRWVLSSGLLTIRMVQLLLPSVRERRSLQSNIENVLASKHECIWRAAYHDRVDVLVVLEDDAMLHPGSEAALAEAFAHVWDADRDKTFMDLAGGLSADELRIARVSELETASLIRVKRAASNTSCAYLVGSTVVAGLSAMTIQSPQSANLPSDWMLNRYFIETDADVRCLHTYPSALVHGSQAGTMPSSLR